tara:strand:+ start:192 stop:509 length:318 start_codon:yes stop_codon:yes gene_type:complete
MFTYPRPVNRSQKKKLLVEVKPIIEFASELESSFLQKLYDDYNDSSYDDLLKTHNITWITYCKRTKVDFIQLDPYWFIGKYKEPLEKKSLVARIVDYIINLFKRK